MEIPAFDLIASRTDDAAVVRVIGELDLSTAPRLRGILAELAGNGTIDVTLDLADMSFIDSTGICVLVSGLKRLRETGGDLALQSPTAAVMKVLDITGLTGAFTIHSEATPNGDHDAHPGASLNPEVAISRTSTSKA